MAIKYQDSQAAAFPARLLVQRCVEARRNLIRLRMGDIISEK